MWTLKKTSHRPKLENKFAHKFEGRGRIPFAVRGQMDAPIELVVAIIILVTSMGLAFYVMGQTETGRCLATLKTQTQQLQEAILDVGLGSAGSKKTVRFQMPRCGDQTIESIQFVKFTNPELCKRCPGHYAGCWQIVPVARTADGLTRVNDAITCIELPAERVSIEDQGSQDGCEEIRPAPCSDGSSSCADDLGISPDIAAHSTWRTLGSDNTRHYLITFNKILSVGVLQGQTQIKMCAKAANT